MNAYQNVNERMITSFLTKIRIKAFLLFLILPFLSEAQVITPSPGYSAFKVGEVQVTAISDGTVPIRVSELLHSDEPGRIGKLLQQSYMTDTVEVSINTYLIQLEDRLILIDAGSGDLFGPEHGGNLIANLNSAGFSAEQVTDVLITHIHLDHSGGLTRNNRMLFPNATVHVNKKELDFWMHHLHPKENEAMGITSNRHSFLSLKQYKDAGRVKIFEGNVSLFKGLKTIEFVGHTLGHTVFVLESGNEKLVFWGDLIHISTVQLHAPEMANDFDFDKGKAAMQRQKAYLEAAEQGYLVAADHISFPGIGRLRKQADHFTWIPLSYTLLGRIR